MIVKIKTIISEKCDSKYHSIVPNSSGYLMVQTTNLIKYCSYVSSLLHSIAPYPSRQTNISICTEKYKM